MAYRGAKGSDPFASKTTRNERFAQMSKQEQLIEQKKREIQNKLEEQQRKESDEARRKLQNASAAKPAFGKPLGHQNKSLGSSKYWKSNDQKRKVDQLSTDERPHHAQNQTNLSNVFSNDGSFLDQFKKLSGSKGTKAKKETESIEANLKLSSVSDASRKSEHDTDRERSTQNEEKHSSDRRGDYDDRRSSRRDRERDDDRPSRSSSRWSRDRRDDSWHDRDHSPPPRASRRFSSPPHRSQRPSSPYSPSKETPDIPSSRVETLASMPSGFVSNSLPLHHPPAMPLNVVSVSQIKPPPMTSYSTLPPPLHSIPPPLPIQPHSIPPPSPLQPHSIPPPPSRPPAMSLPVNTALPPPSTAIQVQRPPPSLPSTAPPRPNVMPPMLHTLPPPGIAQFQLNTPPPTSMPLASRCPPLPGSIRLALLQHPPPMITSASHPPAPTTVISTYRTGAPANPPVPAALDPVTEMSTNHLARMVAQCGDDIEDIIRIRNSNDQTLWFLNDKSSAAYMQYRNQVIKYRSTQLSTLPVVVMKQEPDENEMQMNMFNMPPSGFMKQEPQHDESNMFSMHRSGYMKQEPLHEENKMFNMHPSLPFIKNEPSDIPGVVIDVKRKMETDPFQLGEAAQGNGDDSTQRRKKRRSRWAPESVKVEGQTFVPAVGLVSPMPSGLPQPQLAPITPGGSGGGPMISKITRNDPALIQYAIQSFGSTNLSEEDWKKAEDHYKINLLYHDMLRKREELDRLTRAGKFKYEYDSDEETDGGTWEHRLRSQEMEATQIWADELTKKAEGKHHIGDFLPPDELERFMEKYSALQEGREPDLSDYKEFKLKEDNIGFQMLQKLGWSEGQGLGSEGAGIVDPVNKATNRLENQGLGLERPDDVSRGDDEFEAYRKRMMLAYRFRPNPLNNPRRSYY